MNRRETTQRKKKKTDNPILRVIGTICLIGLITGAMLACMAGMYVKFVIMPDVGLELADVTMDLTSTIYYHDESGQRKELQQLHGDENRIWIPYDEIPQNLINATIAIEDKRFYKHNGVDWLRTANGVLRMFTGQDIQGGSTLTQQLVKNTTQEDQVTVKRKIKEIFQALHLEDNYEKQEILMWYLNYIYLGENCNGVYTASYVYFGKHVSELSLAECASLIGITNNPSLYNPYRNQEGNKNRQRLILNAMLEQKFITQAEHDEAVAQELVFLRGEDETPEFTPYGWYVDAVIDQVIKDLMEEKGYSETAAAALVYSGGLQIESCYNPSVQAAVDEVYNDRSNLNHTSSAGNPLESAITVIDNKTGSVIALSGGVGEKTGSRMYNRATMAKRSPGSSIKPLAVYAPALDMGFITPNSIENDRPDATGWPKNSYGKYYGPITVTEALRISSNCVAVDVLRRHVTPEVSFQFMKDAFNIHLVESRTEGDEVFSDIDLAPLALGGLTEGVSTMEMAAAFSVFPRNGIYYQPTIYTRVLDSDGEELLNRVPEAKTVLKEKTTYYMTDMLQKVVSSGTGRYANFRGQDIAGKTGTTDSKKDLWFVGYTPYYTAAVWTGYDKQDRINVSPNPSAVMWKKVMEKAHAGLEYKKFDAPDTSNLVSVTYCVASGKLSNPWCPSVANGQFFKDDIPGKCTIHKEPPPFDAENPETWPTNDPNFKIEDETTWPGYVPPEVPVEPEPPVPVDPPAVTPPAPIDPPTNAPDPAPPNVDQP